VSGLFRDQFMTCSLIGTTKHIALCKGRCDSSFLTAFFGLSGWFAINLFTVVSGLVWCSFIDVP
jgi:hypothetical protein